MKKAALGILCLLATAVSLSSCEYEAPKLPPGRCNVNGDCPESFACRNTYCEDIYFPRKNIKPY